MSREAYNLFFQEFIERFESYKNILLCATLLKMSS